MAYTHHPSDGPLSRGSEGTVTLDLRSPQPLDNIGKAPAKPSPIAQSHLELVARVAAAAARQIRLEPDPEDFELQAVNVDLILSAVKEHLIKLVEDAALNTHGMDADELTATIGASLSDLSGDIGGAMRKAGERIRDDRYDGCARGPMYRARPRP